MLNKVPLHEKELGRCGISWRIYKEVVSLTPRPLYPKQNGPGTHFMVSWVGRRDRLEAAMSASVSNRTPTPWFLSLVTILTELSLLHDTEFFFSLKSNNNLYIYSHVYDLVFNRKTLGIFSTYESITERYGFVTIRHCTARNVAPSV